MNKSRNKRTKRRTNELVATNSLSERMKTFLFRSLEQQWDLHNNDWRENKCLHRAGLCWLKWKSREIDRDENKMNRRSSSDTLKIFVCRSSSMFCLNVRWRFVSEKNCCVNLDSGCRTRSAFFTISISIRIRIRILVWRRPIASWTWFLLIWRSGTISMTIRTVASLSRWSASVRRRSTSSVSSTRIVALVRSRSVSSTAVSHPIFSSDESTASSVLSWRCFREFDDQPSAS